MYDEDSYVGTLEVLTQAQQQSFSAEQERETRMQRARELADEARLALSELAAPAVAIIGLRLAGHDTDWDGRAITDDRERTALQVLDRIGLGKLRLNAVRSSIAFETQSPTAIYGAYGKIDDGATPAGNSALDADAIDATTVDAQIASFLEGARVARDMRGDD